MATPTPPKDENRPDAIGLYIPVPGSRNRQLLTEFTGAFVEGKDIDCFEAIASHDQVLKGSSFKRIWLTCWESYPNADAYKVGYALTVTLGSADVVHKVIRTPKDITQDLTQYVEVYLYDDIHQSGFYSHLLEEEMNDGTMITSAKLTAGPKIAEVDGIRLMAFVYKDEADFDGVTGEYTGDTSYEIAINRQQGE